MAEAHKSAHVEGAAPVKAMGNGSERPSLPVPGFLPDPDAFPTTGYSRWRDLVPFVRFSREWVRLQEAAGRFPRGVRASAKLVVWPNAEIKRWLADPLNYRAEGQ
ncbi:helix-turn-helix transcriptional regulator [Burkholderia sp. BCC1972]|uniref:helix-turn-helix transcriptional regulator n=1 Tax=Burkholderia sp. BCC1972 TaxID=2817438 RepID=UPI002ABD2DB8|nr:transcriptional regulator [Burkholderia sp. BCC1972]